MSDHSEPKVCPGCGSYQCWCDKKSHYEQLDKERERAKVEMKTLRVSLSISCPKGGDEGEDFWSVCEKIRRVVEQRGGWKLVGISTKEEYDEQAP